MWTSSLDPGKYMPEAEPEPGTNWVGSVTTATKPVSVVEEAATGRGPEEISSMYTPGVWYEGMNYLRF
jgi:hypothetical protein